MQKKLYIALISQAFFLVTSCYGMNHSNAQPNPTAPFTTHFGESNEGYEPIGIQQELSEEIWVYHENSNEKKILLAKIFPAMLTQDGKIYPIFNIKTLLDLPDVKRFIIQEYKKDKEAIAALIEKIYLREEANSEGSSTVWGYTFDNDEYLSLNDGVLPCIKLNSLLLGQNVRNYAEELYQKNPRTSSPNQRTAMPVTQSFIQKNPKTSLALAAFHGALGIAMLWRLMSSQHFIDSSTLIKIGKIGISATGWAFLGAELLSIVTKTI